MIIKTPRLTLKPLEPADTAQLAEMIFNDHEVVATMYQDIRRKGASVKWAELWINKAGTPAKHIWEDGGLGLFGIFPNAMPDTLIGAAGFAMERGHDQKWKGQFLFCLNSAFHDRGLMNEVTDALRPRLYVLNDLGVIYGVYWDGISPGGMRALRNVGLSPTGRKPVLEEFTHDTCVGLFGYDLWNLENSPEKDKVLNAIRAASRAGTFAAEGIMSKKAALSLLVERAPQVRAELLLQVMNAAYENPGLAYMEIRGSQASEEPRNIFREGIGHH